MSVTPPATTVQKDNLHFSIEPMTIRGMCPGVVKIFHIFPMKNQYAPRPSKSDSMRSKTRNVGVPSISQLEIATYKPTAVKKKLLGHTQITSYSPQDHAE